MAGPPCRHWTTGVTPRQQTTARYSVESGGKSKGWAWGNQRATRERRRSCSEKVETHPTNALASNDESAMNVPGEANFPANPLNAENFVEIVKGEVLRIPLPRPPVNRDKKENRG